MQRRDVNRYDTNQFKDDINKDQIKKSFSLCRQDIESLKELILAQSQTIEQLIQKDKQKDLKIEQLELEAQHYQKTSHTTSQTILEELKAIKENTSTKHQHTTPTQSSSSQPPRKILVEKDPYSALLEFKAKSNKREILKQKLIELISREGIQLSELKFLFVEHFNYSSKATFYNYLKELEFSKQIRIERENTKNTVYLSGEAIKISSHL